jgi:hypothetical protein
LDSHAVGIAGIQGELVTRSASLCVYRKNIFLRRIFVLLYFGTLGERKMCSCLTRMCIKNIVIGLRLKKKKQAQRQEHQYMYSGRRAKFFQPYSLPPWLLMTSIQLLSHTGLYARRLRNQVPQDYDRDRSLCAISSWQSAAPINSFHTLLSLIYEVLYIHNFQHFFPCD